MGNRYLQETTKRIRQQQGKRGPIWMCGEQLLEMIAADEAACKLVLDDLKHGGMSLEGCEKKIREFARGHENCCTGAEAEKIIREYFGLPEKAEDARPEPEAKEPVDGEINLEDFFG